MIIDTYLSMHLVRAPSNRLYISVPLTDTYFPTFSFHFSICTYVIDRIFLLRIVRTYFLKWLIVLEEKKPVLVK